MQYHCVQCNEYFTIDQVDEKARCPKCLRTHGLRPVEVTPAARGPSHKVAVPLVAVLVVALGGGGFWLYQKAHSHKPGDVPFAPVDSDALREDVKALSGADPGELTRLLEPDDKVNAFAEHATQGANTPDQRAAAICAAIQARKNKQAFVAWSRTEAREGPPLTASATLAAIEKDGARRELYPLELSALAVAALRSVGVPALVVEVYRYPNERSALDPTGRVGYHALLVPSAPGAKTGKLFDPYGGRSQAPSTSDFSVLNDAQAVGAAYVLRALDKVGNANDTKGSLADSEVAVKLLPSSASSRTTRAALLLATGGVESGGNELSAAAQLRNDGVRHNNLAVYALATNDVNRAAKEVALALGDLPDYALGHITLATVHLMRAENDLARAELEQAEKLDSSIALLPQIWAQLYAGSGDLEQAIAKAQEAVRRRPKDPQGHLVLARVYRVAGRYEDMRKQARFIMDNTAADDRERLQALLRAVLGPTAFETGGDADMPAAAAANGSEAAPQLADPTRPSDGALQPSLGAPKLRLGGGGSQLKLDLKP